MLISLDRAADQLAAAKFWTNASVLALAGERDPVEVVTERSRELVFRAVEQGWEGPPYDPFELAEMMGIPVAPREDFYDARLVPGPGKPRIEFNPTRPRGRVRFSVAHELAHMFFPDYRKAMQYRAAREPGSDGWQLELLCNMAAAELLMPIGSFHDLEEEPLQIEHLMELRKTFDVSAEALLLRVAKLTDSPTGVFAAARATTDRPESPFRIDYVIGSREWKPPLRRGQRLPAKSVLGECTAVGYTAKGTLDGGSGNEIRIECVGLPPCPGQRLPRVAAIVVPATEATDERRVEEVLGDARKPRGDGPYLIVHLVNDKTPNWRGSFASAVKERWPVAQRAFKEWVSENPLQLGRVHVTDVEPDIAVATVIAQKGYGPSTRPRVRYSALRQALAEVARIATRRGATVHMPRIGAGEAGGDWRIIRELVTDALVSESISVTVYSLPGTRIEPPAQTQLALA